MAAVQINQESLQKFEDQLNPQALEKSQFPLRVLGYGEISTVLDISIDDGSKLAYKRMPLFHQIVEADQYETLYQEYIQVLTARIGIEVVPGQIVRVKGADKERVVVYIVQEKLPSESIGHKIIHHLPATEIDRLVWAVLDEINKVSQFNQENKNSLEIGFDGQLSNWGVANYQQGMASLPEKIELVYFDTSTPLLRKDGQEQLDSQLFLRSAPSFLVWILKLFFLEDVLTRYYDIRKVSIDLVANFYKEQRPELIPGLVALLNEFFSERIQSGTFAPLTEKEIKAYYQEDAWIWRLYLSFRKFDRWLHRLLGKHYPYILPGKIKR